ncbi:MAG TPA: hypothetical protein VGG14_03275 [Candidatus Sulfotelmatobacter sp.]
MAAPVAIVGIFVVAFPFTIEVVPLDAGQLLLLVATASHHPGIHGLGPAVCL